MLDLTFGKKFYFLNCFGKFRLTKVVIFGQEYKNIFKNHYFLFVTNLMRF